MSVKAEIVDPTASNIARAAAALRSGEVVAIPTETVYGLAGDAFREDALARIFETKERPTFDPLIVHVSVGLGKRVEDLERARLVSARQMTPAAHDRAELLMDRFWPGPLTLIFPKHPDVPDPATSGLATVAVRMPAHPVAQALIAAAGMPLAAPSANRFGRISPTTAAAVFEELGDRIGMIVDGGSCEVGLESTVLAIEYNGTVKLLRPGGVAREEIEAVIGAKVALPIHGAAGGAAARAPGAGMAAPGMLESHYAPTKELRLLNGAFSALSDEELRKACEGRDGPVGLLLQTGRAPDAELKLSKTTGRAVIARSLSESGDLSEAARRLFAEMRFLDSTNVVLILAEIPSRKEGLGFAIADRLSRAAAGR